MWNVHLTLVQLLSVSNLILFLQWFEDKTEQLDLLEHNLQVLHTSFELLVSNRKGMHLYAFVFCVYACAVNW